MYTITDIYEPIPVSVVNRSYMNNQTSQMAARYILVMSTECGYLHLFLAILITDLRAPHHYGMPLTVNHTQYDILLEHLFILAIAITIIAVCHLADKTTIYWPRKRTLYYRHLYKEPVDFCNKYLVLGYDSTEGKTV